MAPRVFSEEGEARFMQVWHDILDASQGQMITQLDKLRLAATKMTEFAKERSLPEVTADQCKHKLDAVKKKAKQLYQKVKIMTQSGVQVVDPGDLEEAVTKWANFALWNSLFFANPNLGAGGNSLDSISDDDAPSPTPVEAVPATARQPQATRPPMAMTDHHHPLDDPYVVNQPASAGFVPVSDDEDDAAPSSNPSRNVSPARRPGDTRPAAALLRKPVAEKPVPRKKQAQQEYVGAVSDVHIRLAEIDNNARQRELDAEERRAREQRQWQEDMDLRRQRYEDEREQRREQHELRLAREREDREDRREADRVERESRLRMQEMKFQYDLFNKEK